MSERKCSCIAAAWRSMEEIRQRRRSQEESNWSEERCKIGAESGQPSLKMQILSKENIHAGRRVVGQLEGRESVILMRWK